jgi:GntR family transcriptional regulator/MocR family aminotransferase
VARRAEDRALVLSPLPTGTTRQHWLYDEIRRAILTGRLAAGARLPATRDLARQYGLARGTVSAAYLQLSVEGYVSGTIGRGTFVSAQIPDAMLQTGIGSPMPATPPHRRGRLSARGRHLAHTIFAMRPPQKIGAAFRAAQPDLAAFPLELWTRIAGRRARISRRAILGEGDPRGYRPLREAIAAHLAAARGISCSAEHVAILASVQQALDLCARLLLDPGDQVWMENPGYPAAGLVLKAAGARLVPISIDEEGIDIAEGATAAPGARLAYVTPARQAPLGVSLSLARRIQLLEWAGRAKAWIFEDDYDGEYRFSGRPRAALKSLDEHGCVIYAGTFSKVMFPALRLAYVVLPDQLADAFAAATSLTARHASILTQAVLADFIAEGHFARHLRRMRTHYGERAEALAAAAREFWSGELELPAIEAGLDVAARLVRARDDVEIVRRAAARGLETRALSGWAMGRQASARWQGLVLGFATVHPAAIRAGARALAQVLEEFRSAASSPPRQSPERRERRLVQSPRSTAISARRWAHLNDI